MNGSDYTHYVMSGALLSQTVETSECRHNHVRAVGGNLVRPDDRDFLRKRRQLRRIFRKITGDQRTYFEFCGLSVSCNGIQALRSQWGRFRGTESFSPLSIAGPVMTVTTPDKRQEPKSFGSEMTEARIPLDGLAEAQALFGPQDDYLRQVRKATGARIVLKGTQIVVSGDDTQIEECRDLLRQLRTILRTRGELTDSDVERALSTDDQEDDEMAYEESEIEPTLGDVPVTAVQPKNKDVRASRQGKDKVGQIRPRSKGQEGYLDAIAEKSLVFCDGPAGCGKTFLAVAMALKALRDEEVRKIVLVRPAVEAGEKLGFLPGDMFAKVNPFVRPLLDAMHDMLDFDQVRRYMANDVIEIAPLAFMRGRTLNDTFMILDEGQNTTITQMKMFLTRMGTNSRIVVTGDATQNDLPNGTQSGLEDGIRRLSGIDGVAIVRLTGQDIVRHRLVREIVSAYEATDNGQ